MFEPWQLAAIDEAGYNGIEENHIEKVADELRRIGNHQIGRNAFEEACRACGIDPDNFTEDDVRELERMLNR